MELIHQAQKAVVQKTIAPTMILIQTTMTINFILEEIVILMMIKTMSKMKRMLELGVAKRNIFMEEIKMKRKNLVKKLKKVSIW